MDDVGVRYVRKDCPQIMTEWLADEKKAFCEIVNTSTYAKRVNKKLGDSEVFESFGSLSSLLEPAKKRQKTEEEAKH